LRCETRSLLGAAAWLVPLALSPACTEPGSLREAARTTAAARSLRAPDVRYVPTPRPVVRAMLRLAGVGPTDLVYDLGSGDGRIPITAAAEFGARGVGIDIDPRRIREAEANARAAGVTDRVRFRNEDLFEADFRDATVVTLFLSPEVNLRLRPRLLRELAPGTRVVSYWHDMGDWMPLRTARMPRANIYLWHVPPRAPPEQARGGRDFMTLPATPQPCSLRA
jgi:SAM-dependent methyltransferase